MGPHKQRIREQDLGSRRSIVDIVEPDEGISQKGARVRGYPEVYRRRCRPQPFRLGEQNRFAFLLDVPLRPVSEGERSSFRRSTSKRAAIEFR